MKHQILMHRNILDVIIVAATAGISRVTGFPGTDPSTSADPLNTTNTGDQSALPDYADNNSIAMTDIIGISGTCRNFVNTYQCQNLDIAGPSPARRA